MEKNNIPKTCKECPHTIQHKRKFGFTTHCLLEPTHMDVTFVNGRSLFCPLVNKQITEEIPIEE